MDKKIGFLAILSVLIITSGCSYRGANQGAYGSDSDGYGAGSSQSARTGQVAGSSQVRSGGGNRWFGQQYREPATCQPCASTAPKPQTQNTYTYRPAPKPAAQTQSNSKYSQQWYIDRWNKQQQQQGSKPAAPASNSNTYSGYGSSAYDGGSNNNSTFYDYSSASGTTNDTPAPAVSASNKSIYTGSYQQKTYTPYNPKTYAGGSAATTDTSSSGVMSSGSSGGSTYSVKKGDTVFEIMRQTGVYWKDIIRLNNLQPPYSISPGQTIRLK